MNLQEALKISFGKDGVTLETWNNADKAAKDKSLYRIWEGIELSKRAGTISPEDVARKWEALEVLRLHSKGVE